MFFCGLLYSYKSILANGFKNQMLTFSCAGSDLRSFAHTACTSHFFIETGRPIAQGNICQQLLDMSKQRPISCERTEGQRRTGMRKGAEAVLNESFMSGFTVF